MANETLFPRDRITVMGVLNLTPDSFSDGGRFVTPRGAVDIEGALRAADALLAAGADLLDVGGESTRPGATPVPVDAEIERVLPVVEALRKHFDAPISIDTRNGPCARRAVEAGARVVNDVSGLRHDPNLAAVVAGCEATLILGHMRGDPTTMQRHARYEDVRREVTSELEVSVKSAERAGITRDRLVIDPGIGFSKETEESVAMLVSAGWLKERIGLPVVLGPSRKSFLGAVTGADVKAREDATWAACAVGVLCGADAVRVHEPAGAVRAVALALAARRTLRGMGGALG